MNTEFIVEYELLDTTAQKDAAETTDSNQVFGNIELLKEKRTVPAYGTLEQNFFVLDGTKTEMPDSPDDIAYYSQLQADENGEFSNRQSVYIAFSEQHTSVGITLYFEDVYPLEIEISWYDISGILRSKKTFYPNSRIFFAANQVEDYGSIKIDFVKSLPYHNVKLSHIEYGTTLEWGRDTIKTGKLTEDTDPISNTIKINKLNFSFVDTKDLFNLANPSGIHRVFQNRQRMTAYEMLDNRKMLLGVFYMDTNASSKNLAQITAFDKKGLLDGADFVEGDIYSGELAGNIIDKIMKSAGITEYFVEEEVRNTPLYGTLKIQTCRNALREVLFACGAIIDSSRRSELYIRKSNRIVSNMVERTRKFSTDLKMEAYVSDVAVKYQTWTLSDEVKRITKGMYKAGTHTINLSNPSANMVTNVGTIEKQTPYYLVLKLDAEAEVEIMGQKWESEELSALASVENVKGGEVRSTKTFSGSLLDFSKAQEIAENILSYYQLQQTINIRYLGNAEKAGDWLEIQNPVTTHGNFVAGIENITTDLTGGFIQTARCRGYYKLVTADYYAGEIYTGEEVGTI